MNELHHARILIAVGLQRSAVVMATDSEWVAEEVSAVSPHCDDVGILEAKDYDEEPGVYLWEGTLKWVPFMGDVTEGETSYHGKLRSVEPGELATLLAMNPPQEPLMVMEDQEPGQPTTHVRCVSCGEPLTTAVISSVVMGGPSICGRCLDFWNHGKAKEASVEADRCVSCGEPLTTAVAAAVFMGKFACNGCLNLWKRLGPRHDQQAKGP